MRNRRRTMLDKIRDLNAATVKGLGKVRFADGRTQGCPNSPEMGGSGHHNAQTWPPTCTLHSPAPMRPIKED